MINGSSDILDCQTSDMLCDERFIRWSRYFAGDDADCVGISGGCSVAFVDAEREAAIAGIGGDPTGSDGIETLDRRNDGGSYV